MLSTEEVYKTINSSENEALEFLKKYTFGSNELSCKVAIVRFAAAFTNEILKKNRSLEHKKWARL